MCKKPAVVKTRPPVNLYTAVCRRSETASTAARSVFVLQKIVILVLKILKRYYWLKITVKKDVIKVLELDNIKYEMGSVNNSLKELGESL